MYVVCVQGMYMLGMLLHGVGYVHNGYVYVVGCVQEYDPC